MGGRTNRIYHGWRIVAAMFFSAALLFAPVVNMLSLFTDGVCSDFGIDRPQFTLYFTVVTVAGMVASPLAGILLRRFDPRAVLGTSVCLGAGAYIGLANAHGIGTFYILGVLQGMALMGGCVVPASVLVTNWFGHRRGLALGIALAGSGVGGMLLSPVLASLISGTGWRSAYIALAVLTIGLLLPLVVCTVRFEPADLGLTVPGEQECAEEVSSAGSDALTGATRAEALRSWRFWVLAAAVVVAGVASNTVLINLTPCLTDLGATFDQAAAVLSATSAMVIVGKIGVGRLFDRAKAVGVVAMLGAATIAGFATLALVPGIAGGLCYAVFTGIGATMFTLAPTYVAAAVFGRRDFSAIFGAVSVFSSLGSALSPLFASLMLGVVGSWQGLLAVLAAVTAVGTALYLVALTRHRRTPRSCSCFPRACTSRRPARTSARTA